MGESNVFTELLELLYEMGQEVVKQGIQLIEWLESDFILNGAVLGPNWAVITTFMFAIIIPYTIIKWIIPL